MSTMCGDAATVLDLAAAGIQVMVWGTPGTGKTFSVEAEAKARDLEVVHIDATTIDPTDIGGIPRPNTEGTGFTKLPDDAIRRLANTGGVLLLDELNAGTMAVQQAMLAVLGSRRVGELYLGDKVLIVALGNPPSETGLTARVLPPAIANRLTHFTWQADRNKWSLLVTEEFGDTAGPVVAYLASQAQHFDPAPPTDPYQAGMAWPSPRAWTAAIRAKANSDLAWHSALMATVGAGVAAAADTQIENNELPPTDQVIADPTKFKWGEMQAGTVFAVGQSLAVHDTTDEDVNKMVWAAIEEIAEANHRDVMATAVTKRMQTVTPPPAIAKLYGSLLAIPRS